MIGTLIGLVCAFAGVAKARLPRGFVIGYVSAIRNTPLLVIVLFAYFALPQIGIRLGKHETFVASLAIYSGAYLTEVFRAGLLGVPRGVIDAGRAIGLTGVQLALYVVSPIMLRNSLPALGTTFHFLVQGYVAGGRDCRSRTHLSGAQTKYRDVPRGRSLGHGRCAVPVDLPADRRRAPVA